MFKGLVVVPNHEINTVVLSSVAGIEKQTLNPYVEVCLSWETTVCVQVFLQTIRNCRVLLCHP